ncbi:MAG: O-antigen ligase family protein [Bacteroidetes bacterium]|nr:O-antigen ligase family protein [Bacteroidota bacterium]
MKYIKYCILLLIFLNIPGFVLAYIDATVSSILSYGTFIFIILYFIFNNKDKPMDSFILLGILYFIISVIVNSQETENLLVTAIKYLILIILGIRLVKDTTNIDLYIIILLGSLSIIYESIFINDIGGRFSGFYLNPNSAGLVCILGYCLSFSINNKILRSIGQLLFCIAGFVTFSRTFLLLLVIINVISLWVSYKNGYKIILGIFLFSFLLTFGDKFDFNTRRLESFKGILDGKIDNNMEEDSRMETWALYYDQIFDKPIFGNGYLSFSGKATDSGYKVGVHNTPLMIIGEAGIFPFFIFIWIYGSIIIRSIRNFKNNPQFLYMSLSLFMYTLTSHNYFDNYLILFVSLWLYVNNEKKSNQNKRIENYKSYI